MLRARGGSLHIAHSIDYIYFGDDAMIVILL